MWTDPLSVITFHPSSDPYDELMTHLPFGSFSHGCRDRHKAPQHIEPGEIKDRGRNKYIDKHDLKYQQVE